MITSKYDWQLASPSADEAFLALAKKAGLEASVATLLYERGIPVSYTHLSSRKISGVMWRCWTRPMMSFVI